MVLHLKDPHKVTGEELTFAHNKNPSIFSEDIIEHYDPTLFNKINNKQSASLHPLQQVKLAVSRELSYKHHYKKIPTNSEWIDAIESKAEPILASLKQNLLSGNVSKADDSLDLSAKALITTATTLEGLNPVKLQQLENQSTKMYSEFCRTVHLLANDDNFNDIDTKLKLVETLNITHSKAQINPVTSSNINEPTTEARQAPKKEVKLPSFLQPKQKEVKLPSFLQPNLQPNRKVMGNTPAMALKKPLIINEVSPQPISNSNHIVLSETPVVKCTDVEYSFDKPPQSQLSIEKSGEDFSDSFSFVFKPIEAEPEKVDNNPPSPSLGAKIIYQEDIKRPNLLQRILSSSYLSPARDESQRVPKLASTFAGLAIIAAAVFAAPSELNQSSSITSDFNDSISVSQEATPATSVETETAPIVTTTMASLSDLLVQHEEKATVAPIFNTAPVLQASMDQSLALPDNAVKDVSPVKIDAFADTTVNRQEPVALKASFTLADNGFQKMDNPSTPVLTIENLSQRIKAFYEQKDTVIDTNMTNTLTSMQWGNQTDTKGHAEMRAQEASVILLKKFGSEVAGEFAREINEMIVHNDDKIDTNAEKIAERDLNQWSSVTAAYKHKEQKPVFS